MLNGQDLRARIGILGLGEAKTHVYTQKQFPLSRIIKWAAPVTLLAGSALCSGMPPRAQNASAKTDSAPATNGGKASPSRPPLPRGKKLILKDGGFQLVREYQVTADRVRYYSLDTSAWEEMPASMVDWDKTTKIADDEAAQYAAEISAARSREAKRKVEPLDIDASVEAAPGVFLPPGEGLFAFDGKTILKLAQAPIDSRLVKKKVVEQILVPVPIVPKQHNISIHRPHAEYRVESGQPEFYMRIPDGREPELELIRATTRGDSREIEKLDELFGQQKMKKDAVPIQRWQVAIGLYRFTLATPLAPGEYALAEVVQDNGLNLYVWDFGVDAPRSAGGAKRK